MSNNPLLSITIPTKNRYSSLKYLVNALLKFESDDFEVIIQDNSTDNSDFKAFLDSLNCLKIRYYYTNQNISVVQNCDLAIEHSKGEYVCMIGDDDGVVPSIIDFVKFMKSQNIDGAYVKFARYIWPDVILKVHNFAGKFYYNSNITGTYKLDANLEFTKSFKSSGTTLAKMPKVYHGIISKECLNKVKELSGSFFPGPSPDMANAVGLSFFVKNYIYCDIPFIISGMSYNSAAGSGARKMHVGKIEDIPHLPKNTAALWDEYIPKLWTGQTIYAESFLKSVKACKKEYLLKKYSYNRLYASFIIFHSKHIKEIVKYLKIKNIIPVLFYSLQIFFKRFRVLIINFFSNKFNIKNKTLVSGVDTIESCIEKVELICKKNKHKLYTNL